jgi:hypothetical protein
VLLYRSVRARSLRSDRSSGFSLQFEPQSQAGMGALGVRLPISRQLPPQHLPRSQDLWVSVDSAGTERCPRDFGRTGSRRQDHRHRLGLSFDDDLSSRFPCGAQNGHSISGEVAFEERLRASDLGVSSPRHFRERMPPRASHASRVAVFRSRSSADKTADKNSELTRSACEFWTRLLTKLLTKRVQTRLSEILTSLFCMVSAEGIEPSTY